MHDEKFILKEEVKVNSLLKSIQSEFFIQDKREKMSVRRQSTLATNSNFLILLSLQPDVVDLAFFKLIIK